ncbi:hypothetical protein DR91_2072 [Neisseria lactamica ATCC 23970]|nr:hypothetical protein DR91_2072 [Neisseria lactamica ATCC 23970]
MNFPKKSDVASINIYIRTAQIASIHHATKKVRKMHLVVFGYLLFCAVSIASFCVCSLAVVQFYSKV